MSSSQKPSIPKGTRDFSPDEMIRRNHIFNTVRNVFEIFGYQPIETPAMENLSTLLGKYGEEGDKLLFRILNSGNYLDSIPDPGSRVREPNAFTQLISEKGLRYDLTVPFARYVVQHQHEIVFPFKRYQIQPVWRADRPQKGRYREFSQCDVDVIGSDSLVCEVELVQIIDLVFTRLGIGITTKINSRKILAGIAEAIGQKDRLADLTIAVDKLEKAGPDGVNHELRSRGFPEEAVMNLQPVLQFQGKIKEKFAFLENYLSGTETGQKGLSETKVVLTHLKELGLHSKFEFDIRLARGLDYYTGTIIEVRASEVNIGSLCGGGRYDDLTGIFGLPGVSGVGISFGADRIFDVMTEKNLFPEEIRATTRILFLNFGPEEERHCMQVADRFRRSGISAELYPDAAKLKKQLEYANRKRIPYAALIGKEEMGSGLITLKNMETGEQQGLREEEAIRMLLK
jgi:histidyl-tRNA synthetase